MQKKCLPLGRTAGKESFKYLQRYIEILTTTLTKINNHPTANILTNGIAAHLKGITNEHGVGAYACFAKWIDIEENRQMLTRMPKIAKEHMDLLIRKMAAALNHLPLSHDKWIEACTTEKKGNIITNHEAGTQIYTTQQEQKTPENLTMAAWNVNSLPRLLQSGMFATFLRNVEPDVLSLSEVKTSPKDMKIKEFYEGLTILGYKYVAWNWNTSKSHEHGTLVMSKYHLDNIQFGIGEENNNEDKEGRCITVTIRNSTFILPYVPCAQRTDNDERRTSFNQKFEKHIKKKTKETEEQKGCIVIAGDMNATLKETDVQLKPSRRVLTKVNKQIKEEREKYVDLLTKCKLKSAGIQLQDQTNPEKNMTWRGHLPDDEGTRITTKDKLRLDDVLATKVGPNEHNEPAVTGLWTCPNYYSSDHKPLIYYLDYEGKEPPKSWKIQLDIMHPHTPPEGLPKEHETKKDYGKEQTKKTATQTMQAYPSNSNTRTEIMNKLKQQIDKFETDAQERTKVNKNKQKTSGCCNTGYNGNTNRKKREYTAYAENGNLKPHRTVVPEVEWNIRSKTGEWQRHKTLVDSGAHHNLMSLKTARKLGTRPTTENENGEQLELPVLLLTDKSTIRVEGIVKVPMQFEDGTEDNVEFFVLRNSAYPVIIGSEYFEHTNANIDYKTKKVQFEINKTKTYVKYTKINNSKKYKPVMTTVSLKTKTTIPAGAINVRVETKWDTPRKEQEFGILEDTQLHAVHCASILCHTSAATEEKNFAMVTNNTNRDITMETGKPLLVFNKIDAEAFDVYDAKIFEEEETMNQENKAHPACSTQTETEEETQK